MSQFPKIKLSEIRRIGWRDWDPIGLGDGSPFGPSACADEYDKYLLHVVTLLTQRASRAQACAYLTDIHANYMGLGHSDAEAAQRTVDSIAQYLKELPDSPPIAD